MPSCRPKGLLTVCGRVITCRKILQFPRFHEGNFAQVFELVGLNILGPISAFLQYNENIQNDRVSRGINFFVSVSSLNCQEQSGVATLVFPFWVSSLGIHLKILNHFRKWLFVLMLGVASSAQAVVVMTNGMFEVYDPEETYVFSGTIGAGAVFSAGWLYTDPSYSNLVEIHAPNDLVGLLEWFAISTLTVSNENGESMFENGVLAAGENVLLVLGGGDLSTPEYPGESVFGIFAHDHPTPIIFGPTVGGDLITLPTVPEPSTVWMFAAALVVIAGVARRQLVA